MTKEEIATFYEWLDTSFYEFDNTSVNYSEKEIIEKYKEYRFVHYTSLSGFYAMLGKFIENKNDKKIRIFPSHVRYLNDSREYTEGVGALRRIEIDGKKPFEKLQPSDEIYTVSFCGDPDLLSQWKYYGKDSGVAIEFDFLEDQSAKCNFEWGDNLALSTFPHQVIYDNYAEKLKNLYRAFQRHDDEMAFRLLIPFCKNKAFEEEKESRLVFLSDNTDIKYRVMEEKIVPQFECYVSYIKEYECAKPPIKNIIVGPGHNQIIVFNGIINTLQYNKSKISYFDEDDTKTAGLKKTKNKLYIDVQQNEEYVTYETDTGITVQLSPTPFRP